MTADQLEEFLASSDLLKWQQEALRKAEGRDRFELMTDFTNRRKLFLANQAHIEFHNYLLDKGIFISTPIIGMMQNLANEMKSAIIERQIDLEDPTPGPGRFANGDRLLETGGTKIAAVKQAVHDRLWNVTVS